MPNTKNEVIEHLNDKIAAASQPPSAIDRYAKWFGMVTGPVATAVVFPYAKQFGESLAKNILRLRAPMPIRLVSMYFGTSGLLAVSSLASYGLSDLFPRMLKQTDEKSAVLNKQPSPLQHAKIAAAGTLGMLSAIPTAHLTHQHFKPRLGTPASMFLSSVAQLTWGAVSGWSLYYLPEDLITRVKRSMPNGTWVDQHAQKQFKLLDRLKSSVPITNQRVAEQQVVASFTSRPQVDNSNKTSKLAMLGAGVGIASSAFFFPLGRQAGAKLAQTFFKNPGKALPILIAGSSFACNAVLSARATHDCALTSQQAIAQRNQENTGEATKAVSPVFLALLALSSSAHRTSMTIQYVNPNTVYGKLVLFSAVTSLVCTNYWSMDAFINQSLTTKHDSNNTAVDLVPILRQSIHDMDEEHLDALATMISDNKDEQTCSLR